MATAVDIASLVYEIDSTQAVRARQDLDALTGAADRVDASAARITRAGGQMAAGLDQTATATREGARATTDLATAQGALEQSTKSVTGSTVAWRQAQRDLLAQQRELVASANAWQREQDASARATQAAQKAYDGLRASLDPLAAVQVTLAQRTATLNTALQKGVIGADEHAAMLAKVNKVADDGVAVIGKYGTATRGTGELVKNLSFQLNDVITGLVSGQKPMQILAQQGGQVFQAFQMGPGGVGGSFKALGALLTPTNLAIGGLALAFGGLVVATVAAELATQKYIAQLHELDEVAKGVGASVGLTGEAIEQAALRGAAAGSMSIGAAEKQALALASTGKISADVIEGIIGDTKRFAAATGENAAQASKDLTAAFVDPAKGAADLNDRLHFLNATELEHIQNMARSGDQMGAQRALFAALDKDIGTVSTHLGGLAGAWDAVTTAVSNAGHAMVVSMAGIKAQPIEQQIAKMQETAAIERANGYVTQAAEVDKAIAKLQADLKAQQAKGVLDASRDTINQGWGVAQAADLNGNFARMELINKQALATAALTEARKNDKGAVAELSATVDAYTHAINTWIPPAQKAHQISELQAKIAATSNQAEKGRLTTQLEQVRMAGQVVTATDAQTRAADAGRVVADKVNRSAENKAKTFADETASIRANAQASVELAGAYDRGDAAVVRATAHRTAVTEATKAGASAAATAAREEALLGQAVAQAVDTTARAVASTNARTDAQGRANAAVAAGTLTVSQAADAMNLELQTREAATAAELAHSIVVQAGAKATQEQRDADVAATKALADKTAATQRDIAAQRQAQALADHERAGQDLAAIQLGTSLIGASDRTRAVATAQLRAQQTAYGRGFRPGDREYDQASVDATRSAGAQADQAHQQAEYNDQLHLTANTLAEIAANAQDASQALSQAFGTGAIAGISRLSAAYTNYATTTATLQAAHQELVDRGLSTTAETAVYEQKMFSARLRGYGDSLEAAKSFFNQGSRGYKVLQGVEEAYRIVELAWTVKSTLAKTAEATATVAAEGTKTAATVAGSTARGAAFFGEGIANIFAQLGPWAFPVAAAAAAVMIGAGVKAFGGAGGGAAPGADDAKNRQAAQGAGTVLGDASAKSDSLSKSLETAKAYQNTDLEYSSEMVASLRSIDNQIGTLAAAVGRQLQAGGAFDTTNLGLGTTAKGNFLLSGKSVTSLQDQGIAFDPQTIGAILANGVSGNTYQQVATETKKKLFGITYSDKTNSSTNYADLGADLQQQITGVIGSLRNSVLQEAGMLGVQGAEATIDSFQTSLGKLSFKDMSASEITDALNAEFSALGDQLATTIVPDLRKFQQAGEGAFETLTRVTRETQVVDTTMASMGRTFGAVGLDSLAARDALVQLSGGLDQFNSQGAFFVANFLTDAQQLAPVQKAVTAEMERLGYASVTTKEQFAGVIEGLDLTTTAGQQAYAALMNVAPAFAKVADAQETAAADASQAAADAVSAATDRLTTAYNAQAATLNSVISTQTNYINSLRAYQQTLLTGGAQGGGAAEYGAAARAFYSTRAAAQSGDADAQGRLTTVEQAFLAASQASAANQVFYQRDRAAVLQTNAQQLATATKQVNTAQAQLDALNKQVTGLITVNTSVQDVNLSVQAGAAAVTAAVADVRTALAAQAALATGGQASVDGAANDNGAASKPSISAADLAKVQSLFTVYQDKTSPLYAQRDQAAADLLLGYRAGQGDPQSGTYNILKAAGFATGGSWQVGGSGGIDSQRVMFDASPDEHVSVSHEDPWAVIDRVAGRQSGGGNGDVVAELRALRSDNARQAQTIANMAGDIATMKRLWKGLTQDGTSLQTKDAA